MTPQTAACALVKVATLQRLQGIVGAQAVNCPPEKVSTMVPTPRAVRELANAQPDKRTGVIQTLKGEGKPETATLITNHLYPEMSTKVDTFADGKSVKKAALPPPPAKMWGITHYPA